MKYDKNAILSAAKKLHSKSSSLKPIQNKLSHISPKKCSSGFYAKRSSLVRRLENLRNEIDSLSADISEAANRMSSDDKKNAQLIRQTFNKRASKMTVSQAPFSIGNTTFKRNGLYGSTLMYTKMSMTQKSVSSLGNTTSGEKAWYQKVGDFFSNVWEWGEDRVDDVKDWGQSAKNYIWKSVKKFCLGDYSGENVTALSFGGNIIASFFDVDLPLDIRDLAHDIQHWGEGDNFGIYFALDVIAVLPVIGMLKYTKYADDFSDGAKDIGKVVEAASDAGKTADNIDDVADNFKDIGKTVESAIDAGKTSDTIVDSVDDVTDLGKKAEEVTDASKATNDASDYINDARRIANEYKLDDNRYVTHIIDEHGASSIYPNKSKFLNGFDVKKGIGDTLLDESSSIQRNTRNRPGYIFTKTYNRAIGTAPDGTLLYKLKVVINEAGEVVTAYPIR